MEQLIRLYEQWAGGKPATIEKVKGAGSNRIYYRLTDDAHHSVIGVVGTSREENHAFISLAKHFGQRQLPVPEILAASDDEMRYLQTDLGHVSLFDAIQGGREAGGRYNLKEVAAETNDTRAAQHTDQGGTGTGLLPMLSATGV